MDKRPYPVRRWTWPHYYLGGYFAGWILQLAGGFRIRGQENVPKTGGAVLCSNHVSYLDPPVVGRSVFPRRTYYMAKRELFEIPVLGWIIRRCYAFPVERGTPDREAIRYAIELLEAGELLVIFPEGGRSPDGSLQPGNIGPALIASRAKVPIVPMALAGTDRVMPRTGGLHRGRTQVDIGAPIYPSQFGEGRLDKAQLQEFTEAVMQAIEDLRKVQYERVGEVAPPRVKDAPAEGEA